MKRNALKKTNTGRTQIQSRRMVLAADADATPISLMLKANKVAASPNGSK